MSALTARQQRINDLLAARARIDAQLVLLLRATLHTDDEPDDDTRRPPAAGAADRELSWEQVAAANQLALAIIYGRGIRCVTHSPNSHHAGRRHTEDVNAWTTS